MSFKESIIAKLWWFFKLEKRRYIVGILALSLVSVLNLIPPMVMGRVIDAITSGKLNKHVWRNNETLNDDSSHRINVRSNNDDG